MFFTVTIWWEKGGRVGSSIDSKSRFLMFRDDVTFLGKKINFR